MPCSYRDSVSTPPTTLSIANTRREGTDDSLDNTVMLLQSTRVWIFPIPGEAIMCDNAKCILKWVEQEGKEKDPQYYWADFPPILLFF